MPKTTAIYCDVPHCDGRVFSLDDCRRLIRLIGGHVVMGLGAVAAVGMLVTTVTFAAAWIANSFVATNPVIHARAQAGQIGRASCRERGEISVDAGAVKNTRT